MPKNPATHEHEWPAPSDLSDNITWQFHLRHLFGLTTISAIAAALIAAYGPGTLLTSAGLLVAWLNHCGAFESVQSGRRQSGLLWLAWATFLVSLALPSLKVFGPVYGIWAAWFAIIGPANEIWKGESIQVGFAVYLAIDVANLLIAFLPLIIWRLNHGHGQLLTTVLCITMVATWCVSWNSTMLIGYYVWCASFLLALLAIRIHGWTLIAMTAAAVAIGIVSR